MIDVTSPDVYVDSVIFQLIDNELAVLLTQRQRPPFNGMWALPGGLNPVNETTYDAMRRILEEKTSLKISQLGVIEQLYTFDTITRDPRGHAISIVYMGLGKGLVPKATKLTKHQQFFIVSQLPKLGFDHNEIVEYAQKRLGAKITYTNAIFALLPKLFTLSQLQMAYEAVLARNLDKRNFRKKFLSLGLIQATNEYHMEGAHRPARLYKFNSQSVEYLSRGFD